MHRVLDAEELVDEVLDMLDVVELEPVEAIDDALSEPELHAVARSAMAKMPTERTR